MSNLAQSIDPTGVIKDILVELGQAKANVFAASTINVVNKIPQNFGATIFGACVFAFKNDQDVLDGTYEVDDQPNARVSYGETLSFRTKDTSKCVGKFRLGIFALVPGNPNPIGPAEVEKVASAGNCIVFDEFSIGEKKELLFSVIQTGRSLDLVITGTIIGNA
jgi:hypothetical protein